MNARSLISKGFVAMARSEDEMLERSAAGQSSLVRCERLSETAGGEPAGTFGAGSGVVRPEWTVCGGR